MRLLNIHTWQFTRFDIDNAPPYAIVSHRWRDNEATYQQFIANHESMTGYQAADRSDRTSQGLQKVRHFCETVVVMNNKTRRSSAWKAMSFDVHCDYFWIDTVCIDKTDNAELSESINSMFQWYRRSTICYAYLYDVGPGFMLELTMSEWFRRGWTLQELLAPGVVVFLAKDWSVLGHKCPYNEVMCRLTCRGLGRNLVKILARITKINTDVLRDYSKAKSLDLTLKMAWMQGRSTSRPEDLAYSLLGICGVFMAPLYGEGDYAWERLLITVGQHISVPKESLHVHDATPSQDSNHNVTGQVSAVRSGFGVYCVSETAVSISHETRWENISDAQSSCYAISDSAIYCRLGPPEAPPWLKSGPGSLRPTALGPVVEHQILSEWFDSSLQSLPTRTVPAKRSNVKCGICHGTFPGEVVKMCTSPSCRFHYSHKSCAECWSKATSRCPACSTMKASNELRLNPQLVPVVRDVAPTTRQSQLEPQHPCPAGLEKKSLTTQFSSEVRALPQSVHTASHQNLRTGPSSVALSTDESSASCQSHGLGRSSLNAMQFIGRIRKNLEVEKGIHFAEWGYREDGQRDSTGENARRVNRSDSDEPPATWHTASERAVSSFIDASVESSYSDNEVFESWDDQKNTLQATGFWSRTPDARVPSPATAAEERMLLYNPWADLSTEALPPEDYTSIVTQPISKWLQSRETTFAE